MENGMSEKYMGNILLKEAFQKSVNIRYDYGDEAKVQDYIASSDSLDLLGKLVWSTANGVTNRANILIGAYGRGKSHLILVLLTLLCSGSSKSCSSLLSQIKQHDMVLSISFSVSFDNKQYFLKNKFLIKSKSSTCNDLSFNTSNSVYASRSLPVTITQN